MKKKNNSWKYTVHILTRGTEFLPASPIWAFFCFGYHVLSYRACFSFRTEYYLKHVAGFLLTQYTLNYRVDGTIWNSFFPLFFLHIFLQLRNVLTTLLGLPMLSGKPGKSPIKAGWWWIVLVWEKAAGASPVPLEVCFRFAC